MVEADVAPGASISVKRSVSASAAKPTNFDREFLNVSYISKNSSRK
jgi:hypothetical protein